MDVKFNLKERKSSGYTMINLILNYDKKRVKISTGQKILVRHWNDKKQRVKELMELKDHAIINQELDRYESIVKQVYFDALNHGTIPEPSFLKKEILKLKSNPKSLKLAKTFWDIYDDFISDREDSKRRGEIKDIRDYKNSLRKHLENGEKKFEKPLSFLAIKDPYNGFVPVWDDYMRFEAKNSEGGVGLCVNTIGKQHKNLKVFLNWCFEREIYPRFNMKHLPTIVEEVDNIHLTKEELSKIESIELESREEQKVRDLFLIGCETGLRFSDFSCLTKEKILGNVLRLTPKKTKNTSNKKVVIPVSSRLQRILDKYEELPIYNVNKVSDFNRTIKVICEKAKIDSMVIFERKIANQIKEIVKSKFEEVTSHTARRTFCTLKYLDGMPPFEIIKFSGHSTVRNLIRYLKVDEEMAAIQNAHFFS